MERVLDWETYGLGSIPESVTFGIFFFLLALKNRSVTVSLVGFFF